MPALDVHRNVAVADGKGLHGNVAVFEGEVCFQALEVQLFQVHEIQAVVKGLQHGCLLPAGACRQHLGYHPPPQAHEVGAEIVVQQAAQAHLRIEPSFQDGGNGRQGAEQIDCFQSLPDAEPVYPEVHSKFRFAAAGVELAVEGQGPVEHLGAHVLQKQALVANQQGARHLPQGQVVIHHRSSPPLYGKVDIGRDFE